MSITRRYYRTLPRWGRLLNRRFIAAFGTPTGLWLPNDVTNKAYDFSSNRNIGTLNGGITTTAGGRGTLGQSWVLNGSRSITSPFVLNPASGDFSAFIVVSYTSANGTFISQQDGTGTGRTWLDTDATHLRCNLTGTVTSGTISIAAAGTYVFAVTKSAAAVATYVNGAPDLSISGTVSSATGGMVFGQNKLLAAGMTGSILAIGILARQLSAAQVSQLYDCLKTGEPFPLFQPQIVRRGYGIRSIVGGSSFKFRRTLSDYGTRIGSRQAIG